MILGPLLRTSGAPLPFANGRRATSGETTPTRSQVGAVYDSYWGVKSGVRLIPRCTESCAPTLCVKFDLPRLHPREALLQLRGPPSTVHGRLVTLQSLRWLIVNISYALLPPHIA